MQGAYVIAVCEDRTGADLVQCAREHFGALTPLRLHLSPAQAIAEVRAGRATAAVLPMPHEKDTAASAWWTALLHQEEPRVHVVARLPFWAPRSEGAPTVEALVVAAIAPDASGRDRSLIGVELPVGTIAARVSTQFEAAGLVPLSTILWQDRDATVAYGLVEVEGQTVNDDPRLAALGDGLRRAVVLGAYAVPVGDGA
jgi:hypothetical protein